MLKGNLWYQFEKIGYSNDTTCIQTHNLDLRQESIISIFKEEGYLQISKPSLPENNKLLIKEFLARPYLIRSLIIIGLLSNDSDWTTIKTSSPKLFCYRAKNFAHLILSELAVQCSSQAFHYHIQKRNCGVLLEVDTAGKILASGYMDYDEAGRMKFLNVPVIKTTKEQNFFLLDVPEKFKSAGKPKVFISESEKREKEEELEALFNEQPKYAQLALLEWKKLNMSWFERTDEDLGKLICKSNSFWYENNLLYKAYAKPEELENAGVKLLFFLVEDCEIEEIWSPITSQKNFGIEQDLPW